MNARIRFAVSLLVSISLLLPSPLLACGKERWPVKVATDKMQDRVDPTPVPITIAKLRLIDAPINPNIRKNSRYAPTELTTYEVTATLTVVKSQKDEDYHLVIKDNKGRTMIVESPSPDCAEGSVFLDEITSVRQAIDSELGGPIHGKKKLKRLVTVTGVGFFDRIHDQEGVAPNGIELHPLLSIDFHPDKSIEDMRKRLSKPEEND